MASKYGGIPVEQKSKFGGVPIDNEDDSPIYSDPELTQMKENVPAGIGRLLEGLAMPVYRPKQFVEGMSNIGMAGLENYAKQLSSYLPAEYAVTETPTYDAVVEPYKEKYGSTTKFRQATIDDPVGTAADLAALTSGGMAAVRGTTRGAQAAIPDDLPIDMIESVAKFPPSKYDTKQRRKLAETLLKEDIPLTPNGLSKAVDVIESLNARIDEVISAHDKGVKYPRVGVLASIAKLKKEKLGQIEGTKDRAVIEKVIDNYMKSIEDVGNPTMSLKELQQFKQNTYKKINWRSPQNKQTIKNEAYKNIASQARKDIEKLTDGEIKQLNRREGDLISALEAGTQPAGRIGNRDTFGLDVATKPAAGGAAAFGLGMDPQIGVVAGTIASVLGRPAMKQAIAHRIYKFKKRSPKLSDQAILKAVIASYTPILSEASESETAQ